MTDTPHFGAKSTYPAIPRRIAGAVVALVLAVGSAVLPVAAPSASAASYGPGFHHSAGFLGAYSHGGVNMYCLEQQRASPLGTTSYAGLQQWPTASADENARVNWAIYTYGQSSDPTWTAAVNLFVWSLMEPTYNSHAPNFNGDTYFGARVPAGAQRNAVYANLATIRAGAASIAAGVSTGSASGTFAVDHLDNYRGTLSVSLSPSTMSGSLTLTNGVFLSTGTNTISGVTNGMVLQVKGVPTADGQPYKISATGTFTGPMTYGPRIAAYSTTGQQNIAYVGDRSAPTATLSAIDPVFRVSDFVPELTSTVSDQVLQPGDSFTDSFVFSAGVNPEAASVVPWLQYGDGTYAQITASVNVYRVPTKPVLGDPIPADAIPVETFSITTSPGTGPTVPYTYSTAALAEGGYYVAVSTIRSADQRASVQPFIPTDYEWTDGWGVVSETAVLMSPGTSQATAETVAGHAAIDTVFLPSFVPEDAWIDWEVYERPEGGSAPLESDDTEAIDPAAVCTPATLYATFGAPVSDQIMTSPATFSFEHAGVFDWVAVVRDAEGGAELWRAPCGVVSERTIVAQVTVVSRAQSSAAHDGPISDTATINGTVLSGDVLTFRAYTPTVDAAGVPVCSQANLLWTSAPIALTAGVYTDEQFVSGDTDRGATSVWWVEELTHSDGTVEHTGECGLASETSTRPAPPLARTGAGGVEPLLALGAGSVLAGAVLLAFRRRLRVKA